MSHGERPPANKATHPTVLSTTRSNDRRKIEMRKESDRHSIPFSIGETTTIVSRWGAATGLPTETGCRCCVRRMIDRPDWGRICRRYRLVPLSGFRKRRCCLARRSRPYVVPSRGSWRWRCTAEFIVISRSKQKGGRRRRPNILRDNRNLFSNSFVYSSMLTCCSQSTRMCRNFIIFRRRFSPKSRWKIVSKLSRSPSISLMIVEYGSHEPHSSNHWE